MSHLQLSAMGALKGVSSVLLGNTEEQLLFTVGQSRKASRGKALE